MLKKKGVELTMNTIIIAALVIVVLIVMFAIYTRFIGRSAGDISRTGDEAGIQVNDITWCMSSMFRGGGCEVDQAYTNPILVKSGNSCTMTCPDGKAKKIVKDKTAGRYTCPETYGGKGKVDVPEDIAAKYTCYP